MEPGRLQSSMTLLQEYSPRDLLELTLADPLVIAEHFNVSSEEAETLANISVLLTAPSAITARNIFHDEVSSSLESNEIVYGGAAREIQQREPPAAADSYDAAGGQANFLANRWQLNATADDLGMSDVAFERMAATTGDAAMDDVACDDDTIQMTQQTYPSADNPQTSSLLSRAKQHAQKTDLFSCADNFDFVLSALTGPMMMMPFSESGIVELVGESDTGKSHFCYYQAAWHACRAVLRRSRAGSSAASCAHSVLWIDTDGRFNPARLAHMIRHILVDREAAAKRQQEGGCVAMERGRASATPQTAGDAEYAAIVQALKGVLVFGAPTLVDVSECLALPRLQQLLKDGHCATEDSRLESDDEISSPTPAVLRGGKTEPLPRVAPQRYYWTPWRHRPIKRRPAQEQRNLLIVDSLAAAARRQKAADALLAADALRAMQAARYSSFSSLPQDNNAARQKGAPRRVRGRALLAKIAMQLRRLSAGRYHPFVIAGDSPDLRQVAHWFRCAGSYGEQRTFRCEGDSNHEEPTSPHTRCHVGAAPWQIIVVNHMSTYIRPIDDDGAADDGAADDGAADDVSQNNSEEHKKGPDPEKQQSVNRPYEKERCRIMASRDDDDDDEDEDDNGDITHITGDLYCPKLQNGCVVGGRFGTSRLFPALGRDWHHAINVRLCFTAEQEEAFEQPFEQPSTAGDAANRYIQMTKGSVPGSFQRRKFQLVAEGFSIVGSFPQ